MKYLVCYLYESYGITVYNSREEFIKGFGDMFGEDLTFDELIIEMKGDYEVVEVVGPCFIEFLLESEE